MEASDITIPTDYMHILFQEEPQLIFPLLKSYKL